METLIKSEYYSDFWEIYTIHDPINRKVLKNVCASGYSFKITKYTKIAKNCLSIGFHGNQNV
jgi:hypothetical protein